MIEWLTYTTAMWIIGALGLLTYLWVDGKHLLREILTVIFFGCARLYIGMVAVVAFLGVVLAALIGPVARLVFIRDTTTWGGTIICAVTNFCFGWLDKLKAYQDKKIKGLQAQKTMCPDCGGALKQWEYLGCDEYWMKCVGCGSDFIQYDTTVLRKTDADS